MAKMTIIATIANRAKHKAMKGLIKVGEFGKYGENDNIATIATGQSTKQ